MAVEHNLIYNSGLLLYDVPNRTSSPYIERLLSLGAVLTDSITTSTPYFELSSSLYLNNTGNAIANINIDFADGSGLHQLNLGQGISINYSSGGFKAIHYYINYTNGQQVETYSSVYVISSSIASSQKVLGTPNGSPSSCNGFDAPEVLPTIVSDLSYQGYENEPSPIIGQGQATIIYHTNTCDRVLRKPIIILDGFDPGSQHKLKYLHDHLVYNGTQNFGDEMLSKGYDIIFMDYPAYSFNGTKIDGGSDYIQRNAFTLIKLIKTVNQKLQDNGSTEQLVVVGPSMGGLISRYALAYMEHHNMPHNTRLYVSFDSPHLGANIPIGDQWMLDYLGNALYLTPAKDKLNLNINTAAAKEMLLHHYLTNTESPAPYWTRNNFMQELNNLGFPTQLRKIALINGSGNGTQLGNFGAMDLHLGVQPTILTRVIVGVGVYFIPFKSLVMKIVKSIAQAAGVNIELTKTIDAQAWYTPGYNYWSGFVIPSFELWICNPSNDTISIILKQTQCFF